MYYTSSGRRALHQPFFPPPPSPSISLPPTQSPSSQPFPKYPSSSLPTPTTTTTPQNVPSLPFFPLYPSPPPPPPSPSLPTFPANISSLTLPTSPHSAARRHLNPFLHILLPVLALLLLCSATGVLLLLLRRRRRVPRSDSLRLFPPNTAASDGGKLASALPSSVPSDFLYLGTLVTPRGRAAADASSSNSAAAGAGGGSPYHKLGSPELRPLPPLTRQSKDGQKLSPATAAAAPSAAELEKSGSRQSSRTSTVSSTTSLNGSVPDDTKPAAEFRPPPPPPPPRLRPPPTPSPPKRRPPNLRSPVNSGEFLTAIPPDRQPPQPLRQPDESSDRQTRLKLKPLHWDKFKAISDRAMVWDQLKSSSFKLNEEMMEMLFVYNGRNVVSSSNQQCRVLDPKKSQNIAILLKALNVTKEEVCEALLEGNKDTLGNELLETLLKMAPSKEEEQKLREYKDDAAFKLGPAEKFLQAVLDVPFAFKRVDALLYIANFDSEVNFLKNSFDTLEAACEELRNSRLFHKLLEAVLKTGNRMNFGTDRGDARAFKLDTLLKLVDVKGADGKTTLLHFVVQEITKAEGYRHSTMKASSIMQIHTLENDLEWKRLGLLAVSGLSTELNSVKKAAAMESDALSGSLVKLVRGIEKIAEVIVLSSREADQKFYDCLSGFLRRAEDEITKVRALQERVMSLVKETTEYFHGNLAKEEAHPFRIFMVVRDFLTILDQVCKEVGLINDRLAIGAGQGFPVQATSVSSAVFPTFHSSPGSSDDDSSSCSLSS